MAADVANFPGLIAAGDTRENGLAFEPPAGVPRCTPRQRERRRTMAALLGALTRSLDRRLDISLMRGAFEESLRRSMPLRSVHLRESGARYFGPGDGMSAAPEGIALEVRGADVEAPGVLEATF